MQRHSGSGLLTYYNDSYGDYVARFNHDPGSSPAAGYYKVDYAADAAFREALADGHTLEVLVMFDAEADGSSEIKPFNSMQSGGTGFLITTRDRGTKLTFLPNLAPDGWRWTCSDVTPHAAPTTIWSASTTSRPASRASTSTANCSRRSTSGAPSSCRLRAPTGSASAATPAATAPNRPGAATLPWRASTTSRSRATSLPTSGRA